MERVKRTRRLAQHECGITEPRNKKVSWEDLLISQMCEDFEFQIFPIISHVMAMISMIPLNVINCTIFRRQQS